MLNFINKIYDIAVFVKIKRCKRCFNTFSVVRKRIIRIELFVWIARRNRKRSKIQSADSRFFVAVDVCVILGYCVWRCNFTADCKLTRPFPGKGVHKRSAGRVSEGWRYCFNVGQSFFDKCRDFLLGLNVNNRNGGTGQDIVKLVKE